MFPASKFSLLPTVLTSPRLCDYSFNWLHWFCRRSWSCRTSSSCGSWRRGSRCWRGSRWSSSTSLCPSSMTETRLTSSTTSSGWDAVRQRDRKQEALEVFDVVLMEIMSLSETWTTSLFSQIKAQLCLFVSCFRGWPPTWTWVWTSATSSRSTPPSSCLPETSWSCSSTSR